MSDDPPAKRIKRTDAESQERRGDEGTTTLTDSRLEALELQEPQPSGDEPRQERRDLADLNEKAGQENVERYRKYAAGLLSKWIGACNRGHSHDCQPLPMDERELHQIPDWVIDTIEGCIVPGRSVDRYAALSYCWPKDVPGVPRLMLTRSNIGEFQVPGSLSAELGRLPLVVRETIEFVRELGERYLWVDCLCVVQHDPETQRQFDSVGDIYSGAYFTVVAAAYSGLLCLRDSANEVFFGKGDHRCSDSSPSTDKYHYEALMYSTWASRGWTFQEQILSKRMIVFLDPYIHCLKSGKGHYWIYSYHSRVHVFWNCQHSVWDDDALEPDLPHDSVASSTGPRKDGIMSSRAIRDNDFESYLELACLYSGRHFTYPQDISAAFNGVLSRLGRTFFGDFIHGIPTLFMDEILPWQPHSKTSRRHNRVEDGIAPHRLLPSWSWFGWVGLIDPTSLSAGLRSSSKKFQRAHWAGFRTSSTVKWSVLPADRTEQHSLPNPVPGGQYTSVSGTDIVETCPALSVHQDADVDRVCQSQSAKSVKSSRSHMNRLYNWPFITCVTRRARLRVREFLSCAVQEKVTGREASRDSLLLPRTSIFDMAHLSTGPTYREACSVMSLGAADGKWAGVLRVMDRRPQPPGSEIELIAISRGEISHSDLANSVLEESVDYLGYFKYPAAEKELRYRRRPDSGDTEVIQWQDNLGDVRPDDLVQLFRDKANGVDVSERTGIYEYYNVLWVEREGDIAYRRAAGRIKKEVWEQHCSEPIKVILG